MKLILTLITLLFSVNSFAGLFNKDEIPNNVYVLCKDYQGNQIILKSQYKEQDQINYDYHSSEFGFNEYYTGEYIRVVNMNCVVLSTFKEYKTNSLKDMFNLEEINK